MIAAFVGLWFIILTDWGRRYFEPNHLEGFHCSSELFISGPLLSDFVFHERPFKFREFSQRVYFSSKVINNLFEFIAPELKTYFSK